MSKSLAQILAELHAHLERLYGERLTKVVLYGSQARGEGGPDSDIDVLVVLKGPVDSGIEIHRTGEMVSNLRLRHETVISCVFVAENEYERGLGPLLRNVRREGILV